MRRRIKVTASPAMVVACIAVILTMTGSAFAARALITGADIQDGSISRADLSGRTVKSLKGKRGPAGPAGRDGFVGAQGPQGSTGPEGSRGPAGPAGPQGQKGTTGDTGARGAQGIQGVDGPRGPQGDPGPAGQTIASNYFTGTTPIDLGTALALSSTGPTDRTTDGVDLTAGNGDLFLGPGQYIVHVGISVTDPNAADAGVEYGVGRLFIDSTPLDGIASDPSGGSADADTTLVTGDVPDDGNNPAQASGTFIVNVGDNGGGGQTLSLQGAVRTAEPDGASATAHVIVTHVG